MENSNSSKQHNLSQREIEVLLLISDGFSNSEIANQLEISPGTVDSHRTNIRNKIGVNSIAGMIRFAYKNKLIN